MCGFGYQLNVQACALSMLSIHSPDYVFTVVVSIFMKTINISECHLSAINMCSLLYIVGARSRSPHTSK